MGKVCVSMMRSKTWVILALTLGGGFFVPTAFSAEYGKTSVHGNADSESYHIGVGDLLQIEVYDEPDLTREVRVLTDGKISFPLLGSLQAASVTVSNLQKEITDRLAAKYLVSPQVIVFVKEFSNVFVFGEVKSPGSFPLYGKMTVIEAITLAGGFTEVADTNKVKVIRQEGGREVGFDIDADKITKKGDTSEDVELRANDRVIVPRGFF